MTLPSSPSKTYVFHLVFITTFTLRLVFRTFFSNLNQISSDKGIRVPNRIDPNFYYTTFNVLYTFNSSWKITNSYDKK